MNLNNRLIWEWAPGKTLKRLELEIIRSVIDFFDGNKTSAAKYLGVSLRKIRYVSNKNYVPVRKRDRRTLKT